MDTANSARFNGTLKKWNAERGFGFVIADHGDQDIFVHVSAFPRDGRHPNEGELLSFEIELGKDGRKRAVQVRRPGYAKGEFSARTRTADPRDRRHARHTDTSSSSSSFGARVVAVLLVAALGWFALGQYRDYRVARSAAMETPLPMLTTPATPAAITPPAPPRFQCDGRLHCSQMTSCNEAKLFLKNCPGVKMDGDGDGVPCEQQLCTGIFGG